LIRVIRGIRSRFVCGAGPLKSGIYAKGCSDASDLADPQRRLVTSRQAALAGAGGDGASGRLSWNAGAA